MKIRFCIILLFVTTALFPACKKTAVQENKSGIINTMKPFIQGKDMYYNKQTGQVEVTGFGLTDASWCPARFTYGDGGQAVDSAFYTDYLQWIYSNFRFVTTKDGNTFWIMNSYNTEGTAIVTTINKRNATGSYTSVDSSAGFEVLNDAIPSKDGGFVLLFGCDLDINAGLYDSVTIKKYNEQGNLVQSAKINTTDFLGGWYFGMSFVEKANGNYQVFAYGIDTTLVETTGWYCSDVLYETDPKGNFVGTPLFFKKELQTNESFWPNKYGKVFIMPDNSLRLVSTYKNVLGDIAVRKVSSAGHLEWEQYLGAPERDETLNGAFIDRQGYLVFSGTTADWTPPQFPFMYRMDNNGNVLWRQYYKNADKSLYSASDFICTEGEGVYYLAGSIVPNYDAEGLSYLNLYRINPVDGAIR